VERLSGSERFSNRGEPIGGTVLDFWQWACSDIIGNTARGAVAEYLVAHALGIDVGARDPWGIFDLETPDGVKIEVKSSSYVQNWFQKAHSYVSFNCPRTLAWYPATNTFSDEARRWADVYVFCLLAEKDQKRLNPLDVAQWEFHVVPTRWLDDVLGDQKSIGLGRLSKSPWGTAHPWESLRSAIDAASPSTAPE